MYSTVDACRKQTNFLTIRFSLLYFIVVLEEQKKNCLLIERVFRTIRCNEVSLQPFGNLLNRR